MSDLSCFKAYDVRGEIGVNILGPYDLRLWGVIGGSVKVFQCCKKEYLRQIL